ncbi:MAG: hypothetical protein A2166_01540 [Omnitrophica WOR_2 bacterium RBG_13_41_10]|nr:MAG: hypothetical protein A2166_01540 [Omnitrophica WOR_2 bacterium RBG_13_41_10]
MLEKMKNLKFKIKILLIITTFILCAWNISAEEAKPEGEQAVKSELISLDLKGVDILEVFKLLATKTGLNIVPTKNVTGRINLFINNVSFEDALDIIITSNDLASDRKGGIINIMTASEYQALYGEKYQEKAQVLSFKLKYAKPKDILAALNNLKSAIGRVIVDEASGTVILIDSPENIKEMQKVTEELDRPLVTKVFDLNYAKAEDVEAKLTKLASSTSLTVQVDKRTNKVIVTDLPDKVKEMSKMVTEFDEPSLQVLIQTEIWQLSLYDRFKRGIDWEKLFKSFYDLDFKGKFPLGLATDAVRQEISIGSIPQDKFNAVFQLLQTYGKTEILSRPHIAVVDNEEAKILVGSKEAFITATVSQAESSTTTAESVSFIDVGVKLNVSPKISKDGFITMKIKPEVSSVRETLTTTSGTQVPIVETAEAETTVRVKDGTTIMIAGLIKEKRTEDRSELPVLSKIPLLGWLFGKLEIGPLSEPRRNELIICITPKIISGEGGTLTGK